jgi:hypothetical protein
MRKTVFQENSGYGILSPPDVLNKYLSHMKIACSSTGSGGGDPYSKVPILCKSGVRIKILESGSRNPVPDPVALFLVQLADPDHVQIRNYTQFTF